MDSTGSDILQRRTARVGRELGRELGRYGIEITALRSKKLALALHSFGVDINVRRGVKQE